ncbi:uncharacterized protein LOC116578110 [Mustela erminea]|uniref:uncharacterized protein LOC116578110 n=1 Tax=Mustela erminea TaxID=36723 RepID=UPI0013875864|nr:uncharacterized protein LOC116578110 [Mustela erminea]XP_032177958.1 uncharacterized protein LOC116578110 [Mustela erminea]
MYFVYEEDMNFCFSSFYRKVSQPCSAQQYLPPQSGRGSPPQQQHLTRVNEGGNVGQARCHSFCKEGNQEGLLPWDPTSPSQERASPLLSRQSSSTGRITAGSWPWGWRAARRPRGRGSPLVPLLEARVFGTLLAASPSPPLSDKERLMEGVPPGGWVCGSCFLRELLPPAAQEDLARSRSRGREGRHPVPRTHTPSGPTLSWDSTSLTFPNLSPHSFGPKLTTAFFFSTLSFFFFFFYHFLSPRLPYNSLPPASARLLGSSEQGNKQQGKRRWRQAERFRGQSQRLSGEQGTCSQKTGNMRMWRIRTRVSEVSPSQPQ